MGQIVKEREKQMISLYVFLTFPYLTLAYEYDVIVRLFKLQVYNLLSIYMVIERRNRFFHSKDIVCPQG